jgi:acyl-CoA thioester hydrolase
MKIRIYYEDTDAAGVVYHSNYLKYFERARTEWVRGLGVDQSKLMAEFGLGFVVANMEIEFKRGARLDDELEIHTKINRINGASLLVSQEAWLGHILAVKADVRIGFVTSATMAPTPFPSWLKEKFITNCLTPINQ